MLPFFLSSFALASNRQRYEAPTIDKYALVGVSDFLEFETKLEFILYRLGRIESSLGLDSIISRLQRAGNSLTPDDAIADLIGFNKPELEATIDPNMNVFNVQSYREVRSITVAYIKCLQKPLCKYLPRGLRQKYDQLFNPGPKYKIIPGDVDLVELDAVYTSLSSEDHSLGLFGQGSLAVDESLDGQFFSFASHGENPVTGVFFIDKVTGASARYLGVQVDFQWLPSKRALLVASANTTAQGRCLDFWRADSLNASVIPPTNSNGWWVSMRQSSGTFFDYRQGLEICTDYKAATIWRRSQLDPEVIPYPHVSMLGSLNAKIGSDGTIRIRSSVNQLILQRFRVAVALCCTSGLSFEAGERIDQIVEAGYEWGLIRQFLLDTGFRQVGDVDDLVRREARRAPRDLPKSQRPCLVS